MDWQSPVLTEPSVALALRDFCQPGQMVFDVGCHAGTLSLEMSRLVGPRGQVVAIEANPITASNAASMLARNGCGNTTVINRAVTSAADVVLEFYLYGDVTGGVSDTLFRRAEEPAASVHVKSMVLDDLIESLGATPSVLKLDIEGAEWDALVGLRRTLARSSPTLILEQTAESFACIDLVLELGYFVIDLGRFVRVHKVDDYGPAEGVRNVACIHPSAVGENPRLADYLYPVVVEEPPDPTASIVGVGTVALDTLGPGRYIMRAVTECDPGTEVKIGVRAPDGSWRMVIHGYGSNPSVKELHQPFLVTKGDGGPLKASVEHLGGEPPRSTDFYFREVLRPGLLASPADFFLA